MPLRSLAVLAVTALCAAQTARRDYPVQPVPFTAVQMRDSFWAPRIEINRTVTIPFAFEQCERSGRIDNFERAAAVLRRENITNKRPPGYPFDDTDPYKVIEGASYVLQVVPDPKLDAYVDRLIEKIAAAQEKDGYLYTTRTIDPVNPHRWAGPTRWVLEKDDSHELYNLGHLYEAAVAHYQATGKRSLLDIAIRTADLLVNTFGPDKKSIWPGHQITEMGLVKLYRVTGNTKYLDLAKFLLDERGPDGDRGAGRTYNQSHVKIISQSEPVGHAVRATYMYSGIADVAALTGDAGYIAAMDRIWGNMVGRKLYITGGIGATGSGEAFGRDYELPNMTAYNETCASIGNDYWNHRLFLLHGDAKYIDVMERTLYNGLISGVALDGKSFFYPNPLESNGQHQRSPWFGVACCPGNITRFLASVPGYMYATKGNTVYVNLYAGSTANVKLEGNRTVKLGQDTRYPWDGAVKIAVDPERAGTFAVNVRIPGWARGEVVPSDLYRFADSPSDQVSLKVAGRAVPIQIEKGYIRIARNWRQGDVIELSLPMPVRRVVAHPNVEADRGRVAIQRGPLVYAAEWPDNPGGRVRNLVLADDRKLTSEWKPDLLNGVVVVKGKTIALAYDEAGKVASKEQDFTAIPYYAWANRGRGQMAVWTATTDSAAQPAPYPSIAITSTVKTSGRKDPRFLHDGEEPRNSADSSSYFDWWPTRGTTEWIEMTFAKPAKISQVEVYWFDDTGRGQVRIPASWKLLYQEGTARKPVEGATSYGTEKDKYNVVTFSPVTTGALRMEVTMQPNWSAGLQEWKVK
jgi:DUF1680 family protein